MTNLLIEQVQYNLEEAKQKWQELVVEGQKYREKEVLDYHKSKILDDTDANKKRRKEIIQKILKARWRNHSFKYLIKYIGKGVREGIRLLHRKDSENRIVKTYSNQD